MSGPLSNISGAHAIVKVYFADHSRGLTLRVEETTTAEDVLTMVGDKVGLPADVAQSFFGVWLVAESIPSAPAPRLELYLEPTMPVSPVCASWKGLIEHYRGLGMAEGGAVLEVRKHPDVTPPRELAVEHPVAVNMLFLEALDALSSSKFPVSAKQAVALLAKVFCAELGLHNPDSHVQGYYLRRLEEVVPEHLQADSKFSMPKFEKKIIAAHASYPLRSKLLSKLEFLDDVRTLAGPLYATQIFVGVVESIDSAFAKGIKQGDSLRIAVSSHTLAVYTNPPASHKELALYDLSSFASSSEAFVARVGHDDSVGSTIAFAVAQPTKKPTETPVYASLVLSSKDAYIMAKRLPRPLLILPDDKASSSQPQTDFSSLSQIVSALEAIHPEEEPDLAIRRGSVSVAASPHAPVPWKPGSRSSKSGSTSGSSSSSAGGGSRSERKRKGKGSVSGSSSGSISLGSSVSSGTASDSSDADHHGKRVSRSSESAADPSASSEGGDNKDAGGTMSLSTAAMLKVRSSRRTSSAKSETNNLRRLLKEKARAMRAKRRDESAAITVQRAWRAYVSRKRLGALGAIVRRVLDSLARNRERMPAFVVYDPREEFLSSSHIQCMVLAMEKVLLLNRVTSPSVTDPELLDVVLYTYPNWLSDKGLLNYVELRFGSDPQPARKGLLDMLENFVPDLSFTPEQRAAIVDASSTTPLYPFLPDTRTALQNKVLDLMELWFEIHPRLLTKNDDLRDGVFQVLNRMTQAEYVIHEDVVTPDLLLGGGGQDEGEGEGEEESAPPAALSETHTCSVDISVIARARILLGTLREKYGKSKNGGEGESRGSTKRGSLSMMNAPEGIVMEEELPASILPLDSEITSVMQLNPIELARQITLKDYEAFLLIEPAEFLHQRWCKQNASLMAPNLIGMIERFNDVVAWAATEILREPEFEGRARIICRLLDVASAARSLENYSALMAVLSALESAPISRLAFTWELLPDEYVDKMKDLKMTMSMASNYTNYRRALKAASAPCIPYLGVMLQDLTFIDDGNGDKIDGKLINVDKQRMTAAVIKQVCSFQGGFYPLQPVLVIEEYIELSTRWDSEQQYQESLLREPRALKSTRKASSKKISYVDDTVTQEQLANMTAHVEVPQSFLSDMLSQLKEHEYAAGQLIIEKNTEGRSMFFIVRGVAEVELPNNVRIPLNQGAFFGEMALFTGSKTTANVRARTTVQVLELTREICSEMLAAQPQLNRQFREIANARTEMNKAISEGSSKSGKSKKSKRKKKSEPKTPGWILQLAASAASDQ